MVKKGLLQLEWNQQKWPLMVSSLFISFFLPVLVFNMYSEWEQYHYTPYFTFSFEGNASFYFVVSVAFAVMIAISQLGGERGKGNLEYQFILPYSRGDIFVTKLAVGLGTLLVSVMISYSITGIYLAFVDAHHFYYHTFFGYLALVVMMAYTLAMAAGSLTGNAFAQGLTVFSVSVLPAIILFAVAMNLEVINQKLFMFNLFIFNNIMNRVIEFSPIYYFFYSGFFFGPVNLQNLNLWTPAIYSIIFIIIGYVAFIKQPFERNGNFFLWEQFNKPIQILVIVIAILAFSGYGFFMGDNSLGGYFLGSLIGAIVGFTVSYFTIFKKTRQA